MAVAFGRASLEAPSRCLDNPVLGNIIFSLNGEHHLLLKVLHFRVDKRQDYVIIPDKKEGIEIIKRKFKSGMKEFLSAFLVGVLLASLGGGDAVAQEDVFGVSSVFLKKIMVTARNEKS